VYNWVFLVFGESVSEVGEISHSSLEFDLLEQAVCSAQQYVCLLLRIERHKQSIEPFSQGWMCERAFF